MGSDEHVIRFELGASGRCKLKMILSDLISQDLLRLHVEWIQCRAQTSHLVIPQKEARASITSLLLLTNLVRWNPPPFNISISSLASEMAVSTELTDLRRSST